MRTACLQRLAIPTEKQEYIFLTSYFPHVTLEVKFGTVHKGTIRWMSPPSNSFEVFPFVLDSSCYLVITHVST